MGARAIGESKFGAFGGRLVPRFPVKLPDAGD